MAVEGKMRMMDLFTWGVVIAEKLSCEDNIIHLD